MISMSDSPQSLLPSARNHTPPKLSYSSVNVNGPYISITFDDGPHGTLTPKLLDILKQRNVKATFYVIGRNVNALPEIAKRIVAEGHEIANHTWTHPSLSKLGAEGITSELRKTHNEVKAVTGETMTTMRPPYGAVNDQVRKIARDQFDYTTIMWSVDPLDWKYRNSARVTQQLVDGAASGGILLCHDIHATTVAAMPSTLDQLLAKGFRFVTVRELLAMEIPPTPTPAPAPTSPVTPPTDGPVLDGRLPAPATVRPTGSVSGES